MEQSHADETGEEVREEEDSASQDAARFPRSHPPCKSPYDDAVNFRFIIVVNAELPKISVSPFCYLTCSVYACYKKRAIELALGSMPSRSLNLRFK